jgi:type VI protein secretion system component VasK
MALWKRLWILFTVIWVVVLALQVGTILAVGEEPPEKALRPIVLAIVVPALLYLVLWVWAKFRPPEKGS